MIAKVCQRCGKPFMRNKYAHYCEDCGKIIKSESIWRDRTCTICGKIFVGAPKSKYCEECKRIAEKERKAKYKQTGFSRSLGSIDKCQICGAEYIVESGKQKYCKNCKDKALLDWQKEHKKDYHKNKSVIIQRKTIAHNQLSICPYCLQSFDNSSNKKHCSDYCANKDLRIYFDHYRKTSKKTIEKHETEREEYRALKANNAIYVKKFEE